MYKALTITEVQAVEKRIGRKLTPREIINGELERKETRTPGERFDASHWQPKMAEKKGGTVFDDYIANAEQAVETERFNSLTTAQKRLAMAKQSQADELKRQADAAAMKDHLAKHSPQVAKLNALKEAIRLDPSWSAGDFETITRAIRQIEAGPLADAAETAKLVDAPFALLAAKKTELRSQANAKLAELESQIASLNAEIAAIGGTAATTLPPQLAALKTAAEAWDYYEKNFDTKIMDNRPPEQQAALEHWIRLDNAEIAAAASQQPAET